MQKIERKALYTAQDEGLHESAVTDEIAYQETAALWWYDTKAGVGGSCHITHETNRGTSDYWLALHSEDGQRYLDWDNNQPQTLCTEGPGLASGPQKLYHNGEHLVYEVSNQDCEIKLIVTDYSPVYPLIHSGDGALAETAPSHYEGGCRLQGTIAFGGKTYEIDAMGYRDRSWGRREEILRSHRYLTGTAGPDFNFAAVGIVTPDGDMLSLGQVVTQGEIRVADSVDIVTYNNMDGFSHRGACILFRFGDEELHFECSTLQGGLGPTRHVVGFEGVGHFVTNTGIDGFCVLETSDNLRDGKLMPKKSSYYAIVEKGLQNRPAPIERINVSSSLTDKD